MKFGKRSGIDDITAKVLRAEEEAMVDIIHKIAKQVWTEEKSPID